MSDGELTLVPLTRAHFDLLVDWLARPHVLEWWPKPQGAAAVEAEYGPCVDGADPMRAFICLLDGTPFGFLQYYRLADEPAYEEAVGVERGAGMDLFLSEADQRGRGLGPRLIAAALECIWREYPEVERAMAGPSPHNARSRRAFEKAGFAARGAVTVPGEDDLEMVMVRERPATATAA